MLVLPLPLCNLAHSPLTIVPKHLTISLEPPIKRSQQILRELPVVLIQILLGSTWVPVGLMIVLVYPLELLRPDILQHVVHLTVVVLYLQDVVVVRVFVAGRAGAVYREPVFVGCSSQDCSKKLLKGR